MSTQTERLTEKLENLAKKMLAYSGFDGQYINGDWRPGRAHRTLKDTDPYTGDVVTEIALGDLSDVDEAYRTAKLVQPAWASALPAERSQVLHQCADVMTKRREEIVDWLTRESGSTRIKANVEWEMLHAITIEAASFPHRAAGRLLPIDEPGKDSRAYRQPLGVIGVISPWNFPIYLAQRSVGPAIALGNTCPGIGSRYLGHGRRKAPEERGDPGPAHRARFWDYFNLHR